MTATPRSRRPSWTTIAGRRTRRTIRRVHQELERGSEAIRRHAGATKPGQAGSAPAGKAHPPTAETTASAEPAPRRRPTEGPKPTAR